MTATELNKKKGASVSYRFISWLRSAGTYSIFDFLEHHRIIPDLYYFGECVQKSECDI